MSTTPAESNFDADSEFYKTLEDKFRRPRTDVKTRLAAYEAFVDPLLQTLESRRVLDLGCGRGEFLEFVMERGFQGAGVDLDHQMVAGARAAGLDVVEGDALAFLKQSPSERFAAITAFHLVEHLSFQTLRQLVAEAHRCIAPGGLLIIKTPNAENPSVGATTLRMDPMLPYALMDFVESSGFARTKILRLHEEPSVYEKSNPWLFEILSGASPDYAIIAQKSGGARSLALDIAFATQPGLRLAGLAERHDETRTQLYRAEVEQPATRLARQVDDPRLGGRLDSICEAFGLKFKELYWTLTRLVGLAHLHDGSRSRATASASMPTTEILHNASADAERAGDAGGLRPCLAYVTPLPPPQVDDPRLSGRLDSIGEAVGLKFKELYWTFTRSVGLAHIHDGSRSRATASASMPTTGILHNASADAARSGDGARGGLGSPRQLDAPRLGGRLHSIWAAIGLKFKELFWTLTRLVGLGHLHDGSRSPAKGSASIPAAPTEILHNASAGGSTDEIALALKRLAAVSSAERPGDRVSGGPRPRLAYVSPLPPDATGVADYSAELIPALSRHYEINAFVVGAGRSSAAIAGCCSINDASLLEKSVRGYDRIVYAIGNSPFHQDYLSLLERFPGVVVMHDLYLGDLIYHMERQGDRDLWLRLLYHGHGYGAVAQLFKEGGLASTIREYPGALAVLQQAQGFIVHNDYSLSLTRRFYGDTIAAKGALVPLGRALPAAVDRVAARRKLNIPYDEILVCSFGFLGKTKLNHRLLQIWVATGMAKRSDCRLVFVGQNGEDEYGQGIERFIEICQLRNVFITGYCPPAVYRELLSATDIAVQLRADSRGETSGTVLDCMAYGVPTIVNREGSLCELPDDATIKIPQAFSNPDLATPLKLLIDDADRRAEIGSRARSAIERDYGPRRSADLYHETIERFHQAAAPLFDMDALARAAEGWDKKSEEQREETARGLVAKSRLPYPDRQLLVDISALVREDMRSGIQRVARAQLLGLLKDAPAGFRVEPVYLEFMAGSWKIFYARKYALRLLDFPNEALDDAPVAFNRGDVYYMPDLNAHAVSQAARDGVYVDLRNAGVKIVFVVYDILPILRPEFFPVGANETHRAWLEVVAANADLLICISKTVMDETRAWLMRGKGGDAKLPNFTFLHLGADIDASKATTGLPADADRILTALQERPTFLLVGTVEPRKGYRQALDAFERLWRDGVDVNLMIVGSEGWKGLPRDERRTIPEIVDRIANSPEKDKRLFWLQGVSDEFLDRIYPAATCLIAASEGEGFGLPLIEAARKGVPILARDIPVFREVVGEHAAYFRGETEADLAKAVCDLLADFRIGVQPRPRNIPWLTWSQHVSKLKAMLTQMESRPS